MKVDPKSSIFFFNNDIEVSRRRLLRTAYSENISHCLTRLLTIPPPCCLNTTSIASGLCPGAFDNAHGEMHEHHIPQSRFCRWVREFPATSVSSARFPTDSWHSHWRRSTAILSRGMRTAYFRALLAARTRAALRHKVSDAITMESPVLEHL